MSVRTVYAVLTRKAKLSKKSARCVNKWFSLEMKKERFRTCEVAAALEASILGQSKTMFSLFARWPWAKSELASLILAQEAS